MIKNQYLSPHFTLQEFTESATAKKYGIVNEPPQEAVENLKRLCEGTLEPLREKLGLPIIITSGFRTKALNSILAHASSTSQHMRGEAADLYVGSGLTVQGSGFSRRELLIKAFREILQGSMDSPQGRKIDFDQLILYPTFIHVSYVSKEKNRRGILLARSDGKLGYGRITLSNALKIN
jgi:hypothetical protein